MSLRFSLLGLVAFITFAGLASAALVRPSVEWLSVVVTLTVMLIVLQILRATVGKGERRASATGWLLFALVYLALAIGPWSAETIGPQLLSSQGLAYAQTHWRKESPSVAYASDYVQMVNQFAYPLTDVSSSFVWTTGVDRSGWGSQQLSNAWWSTSGQPVNCFRAAGHWLCAWLAGWLGAAIAVQLQRRRAATQQTKAA
jgi:hypothetical protein